MKDFRRSRRDFLGTTAKGVGAASLAGLVPWMPEARAAETLTGVQWGGPWIEAAKVVTAKQDDWEVNWELHTGGSAAIIPKIRAAWPNVPYDFVAQFNPLYYIWVEQGWPEPLTFEEMPNLRDIPEEIFHRNEKGEIVTAPMTLASTCFGYRKDITPIEINTMEDLLSPELKGKVIARDATIGLNSNVLHFALAFGGDENNLEPGWDFLKRLAKSGNICRVASSEVDFINALTSGECAVAFWATGGWAKVSENFPCEFLVKDKNEAPGFQVGLLNEAYLIPREAPNKEAAKAYINWFLSPENNQLYNEGTKNVPTNLKAEATGFAKQFMFTEKEDRERLTYRYAYDVLSDKKDEMIKRFETEIMPLLS